MHVFCKCGSMYPLPAFIVEHFSKIQGNENVSHNTKELFKQLLRVKKYNWIVVDFLMYTMYNGVFEIWSHAQSLSFSNISCSEWTWNIYTEYTELYRI